MSFIARPFAHHKLNDAEIATTALIAALYFYTATHATDLFINGPHGVFTEGSAE